MKIITLVAIICTLSLSAAAIDTTPVEPTQTPDQNQNEITCTESKAEVPTPVLEPAPATPKGSCETNCYNIFIACIRACRGSDPCMSKCDDWLDNVCLPGC